MKYIFLTVLTVFLTTISMYAIANAGRPDTLGKSGKISLILTGIKTEQANKAQAEANLSVAKSNLDSQKSDLEKKRDEHIAEAKKIFDAHDKKHEEGSSEHSYWQGRLNDEVSAANGFQQQVDNLQQAVDEAQKQLDDAVNALEDWQNQLQEIGKVPATSWDCFFDGKCGDYGETPERGKGFKITPNGPSSGAPPVFTELSKEYKERHNPDNRNVPTPMVTPPQKGYIQQATDKVKEMFNNVIKKAQQFKTRRVSTAVLAVRG